MQYRFAILQVIILVCVYSFPLIFSIYQNGNTYTPQSIHTEVNGSIEIVSVKETCTYKIINVLDPHTSTRIDPNEAVKKGLINLESFTYNGVQPSISIDSAQQLGYVSVHTTDYDVSRDNLMVDYTEKAPFTLIQLFNNGQLVKQSGLKCTIKLPEDADTISLKTAITMGLVDADNTLVKESNTEEWCPLNKAISRGLIDDHKRVLLYKNKRIPLTEAVNRGLVSEKQTSLTEILSFEKALQDGLIDPVTNTFQQLNTSSDTTPSNSISVHDAIKQGLLKPPVVETIHENSPGLPSKGYTHSMDSLIAIKRQSSKDPSTVASRTNTLPPVSSSGHMLSNGNDFIATGGRTESRIIKFLDCHGVGKLRGKSSHCNLRHKSKGNDDGDNGDEYTIRKKPRIKSCEIPKLKERNFEAAITDTMVREGRVDVYKKIICDPTSGKFFPIPEALTKGFVFGIVFTQAEQLSENGQQDSNLLYWLEVFHYRHDIYRLERVFDPYLNSLVSISDAIDTGIIDPIHCTYTHPVNGNLYSIEEALYQGWIQALPVGNPPPFDLIGSSFDHVHVRTIEETTTFTTCVHTVRRAGNNIQNNAINKETCSVDPKSTLSLLQTTLNLKRQIPCKTPPSCRPNHRTPKEAYQQPDPTPTITPKLQSQNIPRYILLETAIQRGWVDVQDGLLRTHCGRTSTINLMEAVERALIDPSQLLVCVQHHTEESLGEYPLYGDQQIPVYYSLATLLDATTSIIQKVSAEL
ncbi:unnamed protein product, partial [Trichobilharzia regenti]